MKSRTAATRMPPMPIPICSRAVMPRSRAVMLRRTTAGMAHRRRTTARSPRLTDSPRTIMRRTTVPHSPPIPPIRRTATDSRACTGTTGSLSRSAPCRDITPRRIGSRRGTGGAVTSDITAPTVPPSPRRRAPIRGGTSSFRARPRRTTPRTSSITRIPTSIPACAAAASNRTIRPRAGRTIPSPRRTNIPTTAGSA